eukprot:9632166-Heterocapsa_arctica.AAC.1
MRTAASDGIAAEQPPGDAALPARIARSARGEMNRQAMKSSTNARPGESRKLSGRAHRVHPARPAAPA